jgi:hypothetical protein
MSAVLTRVQKKSFGTPDVVRTFPNAVVNIVDLAGYTISLSTLSPGWSWSRDVKPTVGTDWCEIEHTGYVVSGRIKIAMRDGAEEILTAGDFAHIPPGHDAFVVGDDPVVLLDITGGLAWKQV